MAATSIKQSSNSIIFYNLTKDPQSVTATLRQVNRLHKLSEMQKNDLGDFEKMKAQFSAFIKNPEPYARVLAGTISFWNDVYLDRVSASFDLQAPLTEVMERISQIYQESLIVTASTPCKQSQEGLASGAYLASYNSTQFVMKLTSKEEFLSHLILQSFLSKFQQFSTLVNDWHVPDAAMIERVSRTKQSLLKTDRTSVPIHCPIPDWIRTRSQLQLPQRDLMLSEMASGVTLLDFIATDRYDALTAEQQEELFQSLGRLAAFDVVTGNSDRIFRLYMLYYAREEREETDYDARLLEEQNEQQCFSNFGNLMLALDGGRLQFFLIDNNLDMNPNWSDVFAFSKETLLEILKSQLTIAAYNYGARGGNSDAFSQFGDAIDEYEGYIVEGFEEMRQELADFVPHLLANDEWNEFKNWTLAQSSDFCHIFENLQKFPSTCLGGLQES